MPVQIQRLTSSHERHGFQCGEPALDQWLQTQALQQQNKNTARTFVLIDSADPAVVLGFYVLSISQVDGRSIPAPRSQPSVVPVIRLVRLAVRQHLQRTLARVGELLLLNAIERAVEISDLGAGIALAVDAKHARAAAFYLRYGFSASPDNPALLYLPMSVCRQLVRGT